MNKPEIRSIIIFSVYQDGLPIDKNILNFLLVERTLKNLTIPFKSVVGCYKGKEERSFVVANTLAVFAKVKEIAEFYNQESILLRDADGNAQLFDLKTHNPIKLGQLQKVTKAYALSQDAWTLDTATGEYYAITKG